MNTRWRLGLLSKQRAGLDRFDLNHRFAFETITNETIPIMVAIITPMFAAIGYSLNCILLGGGLSGAFLIFIIAKIFGK